MIHDLDGSEPGASRRIHMVVLSTALVLGSFIAWAAATSPVFQGPFATPYPSTPVRQFTPAPLTIVDAAATHVFSVVCVVPGASTIQWVFVGGESVPVTVSRPTSAAVATCAPLPRPRFER